MALKEIFIKEYTVPGEYILLNKRTRQKKKIYVHSKDEYDMLLRIHNSKYQKR